MAKKLKTIPVTMDDVAFIYNDHMEEFDKITSSCFCVSCKSSYHSTIVNYKVRLNELYDLVLEGFCKDCGQAVGRYIETGEVPTLAKQAEAIWKTNKTLKELKIKKQK